MVSFKAKIRLNKTNGQWNISIPKKKVKDDFKPKFDEIEHWKVDIEEW